MIGIKRAAVVAAATAAASLGAGVPAFAGQAYPAPGFPSSNASCAGAGLDFQAHYGGENSTFPNVTHGTVGPAVSSDARSDAPGAVGAFQSVLAQSHGSIDSCLP